MALRKAKEIPKDAVVIDEVEATRYAWDIVNNWNSLSDTWALRFSPAVLGSVNAVSGIIINKYYRDKLKLGSYAYLSTVIPISVMPGLITALFHRHVVSTGMLLMKDEGCPICYELRSVAIQWSFGLAYPMVLGPTSAMMFANRYSTYRLPNLTEGPKVIYEFLKKITKPFSGTLVFLTTVQFFSSIVMTYFEMRNNFGLRRKIIDLENNIIAEHGLQE